MTEFKIGERVRFTKEAREDAEGFPEALATKFGECDGVVLGEDASGVRVRWLPGTKSWCHSSSYLERAVYWGHAEGEADKYTGMFRTREECIDDGTSEYGGEPFYILSGHAPDPAKAMMRAGDVIGWMHMYAVERWNEEDVLCEDWPDVAPEALAELDDFLKSWARRHAQPKFWVGVGQPERIEPKETK